MNKDEKYSSAIKFPCDFTIKVVGHERDDFRNSVYAIAKKHFPTIKATAFSERPSKNKNYVSISFIVPAQNKAQLDALYEELTANAEILMAL